MPIITLTTDFGLKDPYVAILKGALYKELKEATIVDISHMIQPFDIAEGAFILKNSYQSFPKGSIHIVGVDVLVNPNKMPIAALIDGHYFIASNNGILSLVCADIRPQEIVEINIPQVQTLPIFPIRDIFVPVACHIYRGGKLSVIGKKLEEFHSLATLQPVVRDEKVIVGSVIYVDNYGNAITNISKTFFSRVIKNRNFRIFHRGHEFNRIYGNYDEIVKDFDREEEWIGTGLALFGSSGYLEIAVYKSNPQTVGAASTLLGLEKGTDVLVEFD